ncbi:MAG: MBL fold metallo-hydrolase [Caldilinea sp. CFX5]|nr:MBL fold metallo-hydrolase [Caldilinea sp. CFX5]
MQPIAENIFQIRLPLPFALNHVNCYLLRDEDGWTMLDTGLNWSESQQAWQAAFAELQMADRQLRRIILTHMHPDHFGAAGYFQERTGAPVSMSPREAELARTVWVENGWRAELSSGFWQRAGVTGAVLEAVTTTTDRLRQRTMPHPVVVEPLLPGTTITIAGRNWQILHAPGHADGQLIFYDAAEQLLLSGDQVLMKITPNIGLWPTTEANPLERYLHSLAALAALPVRIAWPGHGRPITEWSARLQELQSHHQLRLAKMLDAAAAGASALTVAQRVFDFAKFSDHEVRFAVAETLAHLEYLVLQGELRWDEVGGIHFYQR